jgi:acetoin utilization deacetylase AcuC-like enzyme
VKVFYCDHLTFPLPQRHRFPSQKFVLLREAVATSGVILPQDLLPPALATDEQLLRAHSPDYLSQVVNGRFTRREIARIGLPWSPELVARARCAVGGAIAACRAALQDGVSVNLGGGTHHASRDRGQGFCLFNDIIVAARAMQAEGAARRVVVIDCDVHQGNGTAALAAGDPTIFTFSIHSASNFPLHKAPGDLDIGLADGTGDAVYLEALEEGLEQALSRAQADLAIYVAGADPYEDDLLGHLALTKAGLAQRDRLVFQRCRRVRIPVAISTAGGYGRCIQDTIDIHLQTVRIAAKMAQRWPSHG